MWKGEMFPICAVFVVFWGHLRQSGQSPGARGALLQ